ncbi:MAG: hypothetical protein SVV03_03725 [Candidatus Nanohaloarchaea archaeon]|nr:hypothetical protein [Candidatus Nanohaloarchaea archaeon]
MSDRKCELCGSEVDQRDLTEEEAERLKKEKEEKVSKVVCGECDHIAYMSEE